MIKTVFQKKLIEDKNTCWDIVKLYHPDIPDFTTTDKGDKIDVKALRMCISLKYDWVIIDFKVKDYGCISIGIHNAKNYNLFGMGITKKMMQRDLDNGTTQFSVWRFVKDKFYQPSISIETTAYTLKEQELAEKAINLLKSKGYKLQSVEEFYKIYYQD